MDYAIGTETEAEELEALAKKVLGWGYPRITRGPGPLVVVVTRHANPTVQEDGKYAYPITDEVKAALADDAKRPANQQKLRTSERTRLDNAIKAAKPVVAAIEE